MMRLLVRSAVVLVLVTAADVAGLEAQANARWYIATYTNHLLVWDEASEEVVDRIEVSNFIPTGIVVNEDKDRLYVMEARAERIEIVDLEQNRVIDEFTLSEGNVTVRINGFAPHPSDERAALFVKRYTKHADRYEIEGPFILEYDLTTKAVSDTIPWPDGEERETVDFRYSPDGETLYQSISSLNTNLIAVLTPVTSWEVSESHAIPTAAETNDGGIVSIVMV